MRTSTSSRLAWSLWAAAVLLCVVLLGLVVWTRAAPVPANSQFRGIDAAWVLSFATIGAIVASRRPANRVGWLLLATGVALGLQAAGWEYTGLAFVVGRDVPFATAAAWVTSWLWLPAFAPIITILLLVFPDGRLPSRRWRPALWASVVGVGLAAAGFATNPAEIEPWEVRNPFGLDISPMLVLVGNVTFLSAAVASVASVVVRFRRGRPDERKQVEWLLYAAGLLVAAIIVSTATDANQGGDLGNIVAVLFVITGLVAIPIACGVAIFRYRLYDIDRIVSRTVSYGLVTGILLGAYVGLVVLFQRVLSPLTGSSDLAVAASTLIVAAAFVPVRRRVQNVVDRRFNRARYDAARTIEAFAARLREQVDLDALGGELETVVASTMQPSHVSLWWPRDPR